MTVQVWRGKAARDLQLTVVEMPDERATRQSKRGGKPPAAAASQHGMALADLPEARRKELKVDNGVLVEGAQGAAARAGIRPGDVILAVNNQDVKSVEQFIWFHPNEARPHSSLHCGNDNGWVPFIGAPHLCSKLSTD